MDPIKEKVCPGCSSSFQCGGECWCNNFPPIISVKEKEVSDCLCERCLTNRLVDIIDDFMVDLSPEKIEQIKSLQKPEKLINGIDYNINQQGRLVFSKWYLLRRGYCCQFGCQNCPYN
jgi:hypothetical protein